MRTLALFLFLSTFAFSQVSPKYNLGTNSSVNTTNFSSDTLAYLRSNALAGFTNAWVTPPSATNSTGVPGTLSYTNNYLYLCVGTNVWKRTILGSW